MFCGKMVSAGRELISRITNLAHANGRIDTFDCLGIGIETLGLGALIEQRALDELESLRGTLSK